MTGADELLLRDVTVDDHQVDVVIRGAVVAQIGQNLRPQGDAEVVEGRGGALLPGLHDHHIHLLSTAAARASVAVGPSEVGDSQELARTLRHADAALPPRRWLRAVGYHESVAGELDRDRLDALVPHRPTRLQHRTGALWVLNSLAIDALHGDTPHHPGAERDSRGRLTGRFFRADDWLRAALPPSEHPDLASVGADLVRFGITGVTDATPFSDDTGPAALAAAKAAGAFPQHLTVMGGIELAGVELPSPLRRGPVKMVIDDGDYPALDDLVGQITLAHDQGRPVAVHCVTRTALVVALTAWREAGSRPGDRIEHGSVIPPELLTQIAEQRLTVVTQPALVAERGDQYLAEVDPDDLPHLYRCASLTAAGVEVAASSDAPYTDLDPWAAMRAAATRRTPSGALLAPAEVVSARDALTLYLGPPDRPGGPVRRIAAGAPADLCLLTGPVPDDAARLNADLVAATIIGGQLVRGRRPPRPPQ